MPDTRRVSALPSIEFAQRTDPGRDPDKQVNEDAADYRETPYGHLCVLCDGMGGHMSGREASNLALKTIVEAFDAASSSDTVARGRELLRGAIEAANRRVFELGGALSASPRAHRPGSTVVAVLLHPGGAEVAHVGDSRCYMIHGAQIFQLTKDHSIVQQMVDAQVLTPAQAASHPDANKITRALGTLADVEVELRAQPVAYVAGDAFILCSDGLSDLVEVPEILQIAGAAPAAQAAGQLVDLANARGGHDNITVQVLRARESATAAREPVAPTVVQTVIGPATGAPPSGGPLSPSQAAVASVPVLQGGSLPAPQQAAAPPVSSRRRPLTMADDEPPSRRLDSGPPARRLPASIVVGVVLGLVGLVVAAIAIYLELSSHHSTRAVAPFAFTAPPAASPAPRASMTPLEPSAVPATTATVEPAPTPAPLPSLVPSPKLR